MPAMKQEDAAASLSCNNIREGVPAVLDEGTDEGFLLCREHQGIESGFVKNDRAQSLHRQLSPLLRCEREAQYRWPRLVEKHKV